MQPPPRSTGAGGKRVDEEEEDDEFTVFDGFGQVWQRAAQLYASCVLMQGAVRASALVAAAAGPVACANGQVQAQVQPT